MLKVFQFLMFQPSAPPRSSESVAVSGSSGVCTLSSVSRMTEDEALAQGYTLIKTAQDLDNIRNNLSGKYILMNDIDLSSYSNWDPIGGNYNEFRGVLDGNGHVIKNLTINRPNEHEVGLFRATENAEIKNLGITNAQIKGYSNVAAIVGYSRYGFIENCFVDGKITGNDTIGGITGYQDAQDIKNCYTNVNISGISTVGGIIGSNAGGSINNAFVLGRISGNTGIAAIAGYTDDDTFRNCLWNTETTGQIIGYDNPPTGSVIGCKGLTTSEMQDPANWAGWDTDIWDFSTYPPKLKWETQSTNPDDPSAVGAIRLQVGANASADANAIIFNTSFDLGDIDVDFSSSQTASNSLNGIDALLDRISKKRSEFGAIMNRLESVLNTQTSQIENLTASKSTIMDADIAQESADYVKNQILQQTTASLLAQAQSANNAVIMALIRG